MVICQWLQPCRVVKMTDKQKILVCGDVCGRFASLFSRVDALNRKSGPFDLLLVTGSFFGRGGDLSELKNNRDKVCVPTYVLGPSDETHEYLYPDSEGDEIFPNITYLGKRGVYTTSSGIKIAYMSGIQSKDDKSTAISYSNADCVAVRDACYRGQSDYRGVDILITTEWPADVHNLDEKKVDSNIEKASSSISWLAMHTKPRYHFVPSSAVYYERCPYRNFNKQQNIREIATRFIGIAPVGNNDKQKWLYACSLQPVSKMRMMDLLQGTTDETECPYDSGLLDQHTPGSKKRDYGDGQFFYDMNSSDFGNGQKRRRRTDNFKERKKIDFDQEKCWFCLSSSTVEKHLVICVGNFCYLALSKGPLTPYHCLILPVTHHQSYTQAPDDVKGEIKKFKDTVSKFFESMGEVAVFFERNYKTSHLQIQCVNIPEGLVAGMSNEIESLASAEGIEFNILASDDDICDVAPPGVPYFVIEVPNGDQLFTKTRQNFPLQLGRELLASPSFLDCEEKVDWRKCELTKDDEMRYVADFRREFAPFDFTQDEE